ncbi:NAD(P)/FAD-dependent oxidoreductase [Lignipirellula cremea]|uniref:Thioredoxin reductase n=1 Tax=Lignipirellula cremea TaxID=2528010 RepID=A0A518DVA6_9BACT|nr:FAD-dependent oxidoreductase [Lignipirellula cremea]QDU95767.1 Thioredoxin reductase [Lignipirellula cremea]
MPERVVIIGSGPAGWAAAIYAARANLDPLVIEGMFGMSGGMVPLGQLYFTTEVENYPGFPFGVLSQFLDTALDDKEKQIAPPITDEKHAVTGPELMHLMRQQAKNFGTRVISDEVVEVDFDSKPLRVKPSDGDWIEAHSVIIATGARANYLGLESEEKFKNGGVSACAVCDGALPRFRNKPLVVIGGGDSAMEEATYLTKYAEKVYLVHRRDEFRASPIMAERVLNNPKIEPVWSHNVVEVLGSAEQGVTGVTVVGIKDGVTKELPASGMFLAIGHTPNTAFLGGKLDMNEAGYIRWTKPYRTNTSVDGVFAAGDVADDYYRQAITSAGTGCMAALDAERYLGDQGIH